MEMAQKCSLMDLQLFAEESAPIQAQIAESSVTSSEPAKETTPEPVKQDYSSMSSDDIANLLTNYHNPKSAQSDQEPGKEPNTTEPSNTEVNTTHNEQKPTSQSDFNQVIKFKENGQEVELTLAQLIDRAQKGSNYERRMEDIVQKQRAFEAALQQKPPEQPKPEDKLKTLQQQVNDFATKFQQEYGIEFNPYDPTHHAAFYQHQMQEQTQKSNEQHQREAQQRIYQEAENKYAATVKSYSTDKEFQNINQYAEKALFLLPQSGPKGIAEFEKLYGVYQKIQQRDAQYQQYQQTGKTDIRIQPFTNEEVDALSKFYEKCKSEYYAKKFTPKPADTTKKPVQTEKSGSGVSTEPKTLAKSDFSKMGKDDINSVLNKYLSSKIKNEKG